MGLWSKCICKPPLSPYSHRRLARIFGLSGSQFISSNTATAVKTRKKYSELPQTRILPDGSPAPPLDAYAGGSDIIDVSSPIPSANTNGVLSTIESVQERCERRISKLTEDLPAKKSTRKRKRRLKETALNLHDEDSSPFDSPSDALTTECSHTQGSSYKKPTRARKKPMPVQEPEGEETRPLLPKNALAVEVLENLSRFPHCILLTRVGQFYESYFDQAGEVSRLLNIKLTSKAWDGHRVLMCGFPIVQLNKYLKILVQQDNRFVAMCEEFMKVPLQGPAGGYNRRVVRIVTPGTLIDEPFLNPYENNYLLAVAPGEGPYSLAQTVGLAWIDVSTGDFFAKDSRLENIRDELARIAPREVVLDQNLPAESLLNSIRQVIIQEGFIVSYVNPSAEAEVSYNVHGNVAQLNTDDLTSPDERLPSAFSPHETAAVRLLTCFLNENLMEAMPKLSMPNKEAVEGRMQIDVHTVKALEIREGIREGGTAGSLLSVIKRTATSSGTRLLARWLCSPSTSVAEINARQALVAFFHSRTHIRDDLTQLLSNIEDATRIVQKFLLGRGNANDLSAINQTIVVWSSIQKRIELERDMAIKERGSIRHEEWTSLDSLMARMNDLTNLSLRISASITRGDNSEVEDEPVEEALVPAMPLDFENISHLKWGIKPDFSDEFLNLHKALEDLLLRKEILQRVLQNTYNAPSLTLRSSSSQGMFVHIGRAKRDAAKIRDSTSFIHLSETGSTSTFFHQEWSKLGGQIVTTTNAIYVAEKQAFESLRKEVNTCEVQLRRNARIMDELDVTLAFANLAAEMNFTRPEVTEDESYKIVNGRHPTVELGLLTAGRLFTPNNVTLASSSRLHIVTGPNMAGKSTLLRQTALIAILAQTGSFVPADSAVIGIVDKVFSRVGAKDDLFRDRSTFMVEMLETSEILKRATPKSLVIMDEVGRGTTVDDGLAIAFATVHHLNSIKCRTLFATHFHELADMLGHSEDNRGHGPFGDIGFFCTGVDETEDGYFAYSYRLKPGVNRDSHGLKVAQLAGMPEPSLKVAQAALDFLKQRRKASDMHRADDLKSLGQFLAISGDTSI